MEFKSPENLQKRFEEKPKSIKAGDFLRYVSENEGDKAYFVNQFGFRIDSIPEGTKVKIPGFALDPFSDTNMPEVSGVVFHKDGKTFFNLESGFDKKSTMQAKFFNGDAVEIISLPE